MDFYRGLEKEENLNTYKKTKLSVLRVPNVVSLVPGFYIEDVQVPDWASKGLHGRPNYLVNRVEVVIIQSVTV